MGNLQPLPDLGGAFNVVGKRCFRFPAPVHLERLTHTPEWHAARNIAAVLPLPVEVPEDVFPVNYEPTPIYDQTLAKTSIYPFAR